MMKCTVLLVGFKDTVRFPCKQFNYVVENSTLSFPHSAAHFYSEINFCVSSGHERSLHKNKSTKLVEGHANLQTFVCMKPGCKVGLSQPKLIGYVKCRICRFADAWHQSQMAPHHHVSCP